MSFEDRDIGMKKAALEDQERLFYLELVGLDLGRGIEDFGDVFYFHVIGHVFGFNTV